MRRLREKIEALVARWGERAAARLWRIPLEAALS